MIRRHLVSNRTCVLPQTFPSNNTQSLSSIPCTVETIVIVDCFSFPCFYCSVLFCFLFSFWFWLMYDVSLNLQGNLYLKFMRVLPILFAEILRAHIPFLV